LPLTQHLNANTAENACGPTSLQSRENENFRASSSNTNPRASLGSPRTNHRAAASCFHADKKTMRALAPRIRRLISPFHFFCL
jgi:hypothetical protein